MRTPIALLAATLTVLPAGAASADIGPFRGTGTGLVDRFHRMVRPEDNFHSNSKDVYRGRFVYSFSVNEHGIIRGRGQGAYQSATWHLDGNNGDKGAFNCDIPMTFSPSWTVEISGQVVDGEARPKFEPVGATERNEDYDCGADYTGFAQTSGYLAGSLMLVQIEDGPISVDLAQPRIAPLRFLETSGDERDNRVNLHEWDFTIQAPDRVQDTGPSAGPGFQSRPPRGGGGGSAICTIEGTRRGDRVNGTRGNDVICTYGGNDRINGRGGHDLVYAGPGNDRVIGGRGLDALYGNFGNDRFSTRDRKRDKAHGGTGDDAAVVDRRDATVAVERVNRR
jgi:hypothetical protein